MSGWFKIWRKAFKNPYLRESDAFKLFFYLVSECSWEKEEKFIKQARSVIVLMRGQCWVSVRQLVEDIGVTRRRIDTLMKRLKTGTLIETQTGTHGTIVTICNYDEYQDDEKKPGHKPGHKPRINRDTTGTPIEEEREEREERSTDSESLQLTCPASPDLHVLDFEFWWNCWRLKGAKRGDKKRTKEIYEATIKSGKKTHEQLCVAVELQQRAYEANGTPTKNQLHPRTWLSQERWNDELVIENPNGGGSGFLKPTSQLARELENELRGSDLAFAPVDGNGQGDQPDRQAGPGPGNQRNGQGLLEVPAWFDQEGGG